MARAAGGAATLGATGRTLSKAGVALVPGAPAGAGLPVILACGFTQVRYPQAPVCTKHVTAHIVTAHASWAALASSSARARSDGHGGAACAAGQLRQGCVRPLGTNVARKQASASTRRQHCSGEFQFSLHAQMQVLRVPLAAMLRSSIGMKSEWMAAMGPVLTATTAVDYSV